MTALFTLCHSTKNMTVEPKQLKVAPLPSNAIAQNLSRLYNNSKLSDVKLELPKLGTEIYANKLVLAAHSTFFDQLFFDDNGPKQSTSYRVENAPEEVFQEMIQYLYTEELTISDTNVTALKECASTYGVLSLLEKCEEFFAQNLTVDNVFGFIERAQTSNMKNLLASCVAYVCRFAKRIFLENLHFKMAEEVILQIVPRDDLRIKELDLFKSLVRWCENKFPAQKEKQLNSLQKFSPFIRYTCIDMKDLMTTVFPTNVLSAMERIQVLEKQVLDGASKNRRKAHVDFEIHRESLSFKQLLDDGWKIIYQKPFSHPTKNQELKDLHTQYAANQETLICAIGKDAKNDLIDLCAFGNLCDALAVTPTKTAAIKFGNVCWYNVVDQSFGFADNTMINLNSADTTTGDLRYVYNKSVV